MDDNESTDQWLTELTQTELSKLDVEMTNAGISELHLVRVSSTTSNVTFVFDSGVKVHRAIQFERVAKQTK